MPFFMTFSTFSCRTIVRQRNRDNKQSDNKIKSDLRVPVGCTESSQLEPAEADRAVWTQAPPDRSQCGVKKYLWLCLVSISQWRTRRRQKRCCAMSRRRQFKESRRWRFHSKAALNAARISSISWARPGGTAWVSAVCAAGIVHGRGQKVCYFSSAMFLKDTDRDC